ncbi:proteasome accessory factor PafA2 family protein [Candidatus Acetothermia bacterium]|nr:proteasome accessory factor PafA2 family protein [Candidatus Acetothermia bacterium]
MLNRIVGLETEFGCLVRDPSLGSPEDVVNRIKEAAFKNGRWGLLDQHTRDMYFEPAESGGFLVNGGRLYVDAVGSHLEFATPECRSLRDLIAYDKAGHRLIQSVIDELGWSERVSFHNNSVDHFGGHTFGCHENYSVNPDSWSLRSSVTLLIPFLVTRQIFAGAGRVGGHRLTADPDRAIRQIGRNTADYVFVDRVYGVEPDPTINFQLSQRADHILHVVSGRVRFSRALINPKWDQSHELSRSPRLHILFGEANPSEYTTFLKMGTTVLVLDLLEANLAPAGVELEDPIHALKEVSRDFTWRWPVRRRDGKKTSALEIQRAYLQAAQKHFSHRDEETDQILKAWQEVLDTLERDPKSLSDRLDWVAKYEMFSLFAQSENLDWNDEAIHSLDLEYHNIDPAKGLFYSLEGMRRLTDEAMIERALRTPPANTRAKGRARVVQGLKEKRIEDYVVEWDGVYVEPKQVLVFEDPFQTYEAESEKFLKKL